MMPFLGLCGLRVCMGASALSRVRGFRVQVGDLDPEEPTFLRTYIRNP